MRSETRLDAAILCAYFVPVIGNIVWRPLIGLMQSALFAAGVVLLLAPGGSEVAGWIVMAGAWIWSLVTLETGWNEQRRKQAASVFPQ